MPHSRGIEVWRILGGRSSARLAIACRGVGHLLRTRVLRSRARVWSCSSRRARSVLTCRDTGCGIRRSSAFASAFRHPNPRRSSMPLGIGLTSQAHLLAPGGLEPRQEVRARRLFASFRSGSELHARPLEAGLAAGLARRGGGQGDVTVTVVGEPKPRIICTVIDHRHGLRNSPSTASGCPASASTRSWPTSQPADGYSFRAVRGGMPGAPEPVAWRSRTPRKITGARVAGRLSLASDKP